jgi:hypothetical protein
MSRCSSRISKAFMVISIRCRPGEKVAPEPISLRDAGDDLADTKREMCTTKGNEMGRPFDACIVRIQKSS